MLNDTKYGRTNEICHVTGTTGVFVRQSTKITNYILFSDLNKINFLCDFEQKLYLFI